MNDEWREQNKGSLQQFQYMLQNSLLTDCTFIVGNMEQRFPCHKLMLARVSSVFMAMLYGPLAETEEIIVQDLQAETFKDLLFYVYSDQVNLQSCFQAMGLCYAGNKYMISDLQQKCVDFLCSHLDADNAWKALELADIISEERLHSKCLSVMQQETDKMVTTPDFEEIPLSSLEILLSEPHLNVSSELVLVEAAARWACKEAQRCGVSPRQALGPKALELLRFLLLTQAQISRSQGITQLLTEKEKTSLQKRRVLPKGFSKSTEPRTFQVKLTYTLKRATSANCTSYFVSKSSSVLRCSLSFHTSRHIWLQGCELFAQECGSSAAKFRGNPPAGNSYNEEIVVSLLRVTTDDKRTAEVLAVCDFKSVVKYGTLSKVMFPNPVYLEMHDKVVYCLRISLFKDGHYPIKDTWSMMDYGNLKFVFEPYSNDTFTWGNGGIVASFIFFANGVE